MGEKGDCRWGTSSDPVIINGVAYVADQYTLLLNCTVDGSATTSSEVPLTPFALWSNGPSARYNIAHVFVTSFILGAIILTTIIGNVFVIAAIVLERNLRNVANYLIASLAVADLMVAVLVMPLAVVNEVSARWFLGSEACDAFVVIDVICCTASILHLVAISLDRYWAVSRIDYMHNRSARRILTMIAASWSLSVLISVPPLFGLRDPLEDPELTGVCLISQNWAYTVFSTIGAFYLPMLAMFVIYARIYRTAQMRIRKHNFRRAVPRAAVAAGLVVVAAERLRDGAMMCSASSAQESPIPRQQLTKTFFSSSMTPQHQPKTTDASSSTSKTIVRNGSGSGFDSPTVVATSDGPREPPLSHPLQEQTRQGLVATMKPPFAIDGGDANEYDDDTADAEESLEIDDREYSPVTAVGNVCSIILAAATAQSHHQHHQHHQQQQHIAFMDEHNDKVMTVTAKTTTESVVPVPLTRSNAAPVPFFVRFIDRYGSWIPMTNTRHRFQQQLSSSSECSVFAPTANTIDSDEGSTSFFPSESMRSRPPTDADLRSGLAAASANASRRAREKQEQKRERKATRTLAIVTGTFVGCWLPFFIVALVRPFCGASCELPPLVVSIIGWLGYVNSLLNPVIYTVFSPDFRSAFRKILFGKYHRAAGRGQMHALHHLPFARR